VQQESQKINMKTFLQNSNTRLCDKCLCDATNNWLCGNHNWKRSIW